MKRTVAVVTVAAAAVLAAPGAAQQPAPGARTITFKELDRGSVFRFVDVPPRARNPRRPTFSLGDYFVIRTPLVSDAGAPMGQLHARCTVTRPARNPTALCDGMFVLADGSLSVTALTTFSEQGTTTGPVVGGTGAYVGARGTFVSRSTRTGSDDTVTLLP